MLKTDLSKFNNNWYNPGRGALIRFLWMATSACWVNSWWPFSGCKKFCLRLFGAEIGEGVVIKPYVNVKYPWRLRIGDNCWIGESTWIDNLADVTIEKNVCVSQGAMLLTGNHNYKKISFDLIIGEITLKEGCWIGAKSLVCPGVTVEEHAVLNAGSIATKRLEAFGIYSGNPAQKVKQRILSS